MLGMGGKNAGDGRKERGQVWYIDGRKGGRKAGDWWCGMQMDGCEGRQGPRRRREKDGPDKLSLGGMKRRWSVVKARRRERKEEK